MTVKMQIILILLALTRYFVASQTTEKIQLDRVEQVYADKTIVDFSRVVLHFVNGVKVISGEVLLNTYFGNNFLVEYFAYIRQSGEFERIYHAPRRPLCDFFADDKFFYPDLARNSDFPEDIKRKCPLGKEVYRIRNANLRFERIPRENIKSGDYMGEMRFYIRDNMILQWRIYASVA